MSKRSKSSIIFEPVNSSDPCKTIVQSNLNIKKDATLKCDLDVKKCLNVKNVVYCEENIDETCQNISSDISLTWVNTNGEGYLEEGKKDGMYKKIVKTVTGTTNDVWSRLGTFPNNYLDEAVNSIALDPNNEDNVYVCGFFDGTFGNPDLKFVAKYTKSTNTWSPVGNIDDFNGEGLKIIFNPVTREGPYIGGNFTQVGGDPNLNYLVKWDGSGWTSIRPGGDQIGPINPAVFVQDILFTPDGSGPYICGLFNQIQGIPTESIAYFDGTNWLTHSIGGIFRYTQLASGTLFGVPNRLIVANDIPFLIFSLLIYDFPLNIAGTIETNARIYSVSLSPSNILHIGSLGIPGEYISGITGLYLAKNIPGTLSWTSVSGQTGEFNNLITNISFEQTSENPYVGGRFTQVDGNPNLNLLTKWGGTSVGWTSINPCGDNILFDPISNNNNIRDIKFSSDYKNIYVGGQYIKSANRPINIAKYGPSNEYIVRYNNNINDHVLTDNNNAVSFIYNEDLDEWIKLN